MAHDRKRLAQIQERVLLIKLKLFLGASIVAKDFGLAFLDIDPLMMTGAKAARAFGLTLGDTLDTAPVDDEFVNGAFLFVAVRAMVGAALGPWAPDPGPGGDSENSPRARLARLWIQLEDEFGWYRA